MEPLPENLLEEIAGEQLAIDVAALSGRTVEDVKASGAQSSLVALFMTGGVPDGRMDLQRLAQGESFVRPPTETADPPTGASEPATGPAALDATLGITASNGTGNNMPTGQPRVPNVLNEPNAALSAVPWGAPLDERDNGVAQAGVWRFDHPDQHSNELFENENALVGECLKSVKEEPIAFAVFRRIKATAMRRLVAGGAGGNARMKLAKTFNHQFTDHISTHEWDGNGPNDWPWTLGPLSLNSAATMTDPMCYRSLKLLLSLNEIIERRAMATTRGQCLIEWRLMGHTMAPLCQAVGGGLEHDCSTWDEISL
ncbi:unnamed protein product [Symbiodinium sp. CCMP2592]|nr:unnamed protein product [Symbiodinium sp. CCMP2592]